MVKPQVQKHSTSPALALGRAAGVANLVFMTDSARAPDPVRVCNALPAGSIIICRDYDHADRLGLAMLLRRVTRSQKQLLLVAGDPALARLVGADGVHLPEYQLRKSPKLAIFSLVSAACHTASSILRAQRIGVDFAIVSPIFATESHPHAAKLGVHKLARLVKISRIPLVALGGITAENVGQLKGVDLMGIAAIGAFARL